jgi:4-amino-4-deoxy-L-arabinose transferase-like glycosyltransferase
MWQDEVYCVDIAKESIQDQIAFTLYTTRSTHLHPPLYTILLHFFLYLGDNEFTARLSSAIFGILSIVAIFKIGKLLFGTNEGLASALLLAVSVVNIWQSRETVMYSQFMFFALLSIFFFYRAITEDKGKMWVAFVASTLLGIYTHFFMFYIVIVETPFFVYWLHMKGGLIARNLPRLGKKSLLLLILLLATTSILMIPILQMASSILKQGNLGREYGLPPESFWKLFAYFSGNELGMLIFIPILLIGLLASAKKHKLSTVFLIVWVFLPTAIALVMSLRLGTDAYVTVRMMMFILPGYLIGVSRGIGVISHGLLNRIHVPAAVGPSETKLIITSLLLIIVFFGGVITSSLIDYYRQENADWRSVAQYLEAKAGSGEIILMIDYGGAGKIFSYYYRESEKNATVVFPSPKILISSNLSSIHVGIWFVTPDPPRASGDQVENTLYVEGLKKWVTNNHLTVVARFTGLVILNRQPP